MTKRNGRDTDAEIERIYRQRQARAFILNKDGSINIENMVAGYRRERGLPPSPKPPKLKRRI
jgi:hypothetical protein